MIQPLTFGPLEKEVMHILWEQGPGCCVRDIFCTLQTRRDIAYTTVMTVMNRLVDKGALIRSREGKAHTYTAAISHQDMLRMTIRSFFQTLQEHDQEGAQALAQEFSLLAPKDQLIILKALTGSAA